MPEEKQYTLSNAIDRFVPDGSSVVMGASLESLIPFAAGHEIIRQERRELTLIGPISDMLFDQLIGAGCVRKVRAAWVGNVITGSGYNFRKAAENRAIDIEDHSNLTLAMALKAGAMGVSFMPVQTALGSDLFKTNPSLKLLDCPFTGQKMAAVAAIRPDVAVIHAQRADKYGAAHAWGNLGVARDACLAARRIIITAEEIVPPEIIAGDPNRIITPGFRVTAVVHVPWGAHPSPTPGYYNRDHQAFIDYRNASKTPGDFKQWRAQWIDPAPTPDAYLDLLGEDRRTRLTIKRHAASAPVDYGY
ncbi:MAG: CoA transferase subunit A [Desulfobacterales bacterium]|nr:CoA transferase subunit A [Desulfobacterales bacterium]